MTRHVIFEVFRKASFWKRIKCLCHVWKELIDIELGWNGDYMVSMKIDQCIDCGTQQLWVLREHKIEYDFSKQTENTSQEETKERRQE